MKSVVGGLSWIVWGLLFSIPGNAAIQLPFQEGNFLNPISSRAANSRSKNESFTTVLLDESGQRHPIRLSRRHFQRLSGDFYEGEFLAGSGGEFSYFKGPVLSAGHVRFPGANRTLRFIADPQSSSEYVAAEVIPETGFRCGTSSSARPVPKSVSVRPRVLPARPVFRLVIGYTTQAKVLMGGRDVVETYIGYSYADLLRTLENSLIDIDVELSYVGETSFQSLGYIANDLSFFSNHADIQAWELAFGAHLVTLISDAPNEKAYAGIAYLGGSSSVIDYKELGGGTFTHEIGHSFSANHNREQLGVPTGGGYAYGYNFKGQDGVLYATTMSYGPGSRVPYYSNPNLTFQGVPLGLPSTDPRAADNSRTIRDAVVFKVNAFSYQPGAGVFEFESEKVNVVEGAWQSVKVVRRGSAALGERLNIEIDGNSGLVEGTEFALASKQIEFQPGQTEARLQVWFRRNPFPGCPRPVRLKLSSSDGLGVLGGVPETEISPWPADGAQSPSFGLHQFDAFQDFSPRRLVLGGRGGATVLLNQPTQEKTGGGGTLWDKLFLRLNESGEVDREFTSRLPLSQVTFAGERSDGTSFFWATDPASGVTGLYAADGTGALIPGFFISLDRTPLVSIEGTDGSMYFGGAFTQVNGVSRVGVFRVLPNDQFDTNWDLGAPYWVVPMAASPGGEMLMAANRLLQGNSSVYDSVLYRLSSGGQLLDSTHFSGRISRVFRTVGGWVLSVVDSPTPVAKPKRLVFLPDGAPNLLSWQDLDLSFLGSSWNLAEVDANGDFFFSGAFTEVQGIQTGGVIHTDSRFHVLSCVPVEGNISMITLRGGRAWMLGTFTAALGQKVNHLMKWEDSLARRATAYPVETSIHWNPWPQFSNELSIDLSGPVGFRYGLEGTENLRSWRKLGEWDAPGGLLRIGIDPAKFPMKFYRGEIGPPIPSPSPSPSPRPSPSPSLSPNQN